MMKISRYLLVVFVSGIFFISVSAVGAQQRFPAKAPQSATSGEEGGKAGIIVVDGTIGSKGDLDSWEEEGWISRPDGATGRAGDVGKPRQPISRLEPGTTLKPGGPDTLQRQDVPRGKRGIGGVIPPDFDGDATKR